LKTKTRRLFFIDNTCVHIRGLNFFDTLPYLVTCQVFLINYTGSTDYITWCFNTKLHFTNLFYVPLHVNPMKHKDGGAMQTHENHLFLFNVQCAMTTVFSQAIEYYGLMA